MDFIRRMKKTNAGRFLLDELMELLVFIIVTSVLKSFFGENKIAITIVGMILLAAMGVSSFVYLYREYRDWKKLIHIYNGNVRMQQIDQMIKTYKEDGFQQTEVFEWISKVYKEKYDLNELLSRQHFVRNQLKEKDNLLEVMVTIMVSALFQYVPYFLDEFGFVNIFLRIFVYMCMIMMLIIVIQMAVIQPQHSEKWSFYEYEAKVIAKKLYKVQKGISKKKRK